MLIANQKESREEFHLPTFDEHQIKHHLKLKLGRYNKKNGESLPCKSVTECSDTYLKYMEPKTKCLNCIFPNICSKAQKSNFFHKICPL